MRLLGYLFVLAVALAIVGYARGWFTVQAGSRAGNAEVHVAVDRDRVAGDKKAVLDAVGGGGAPTERPDAPTPSGASSSVDGRITAVHAATQEISIEAGSRTSTHRITGDAPITRDGARVAFDRLLPDMRARFSFDDQRPVPRVTAVVLLP